MYRTLYKILWKVVEKLYGQNLGCEAPMGELELLTITFQLERTLEEWQSTLPREMALKIENPINFGSTDERPFERFRIILTLRYLNLDVLLHRQALVRSIDERIKDDASPTSKSVDNMQANCIQTCIRSAETIISILHTVITADGGSKDLLGAWWFSLYYCKLSTICACNHAGLLDTDLSSF